MSQDNLLQLFIQGETPTPSPNGSQTVFNTANAYRAGTLRVYRDGLLLYGGGIDYSETTETTFTLNVAPDSDEQLKTDYIKKVRGVDGESSIVSSIIQKIRDIIEENLANFNEVFIYSSSEVFPLGELNVSTVDYVSVNGDDLDDDDWEYNSVRNRVSVDYSSLAEGDVIKVEGTSYPNYSDNEIKGYIRAALTYLSVNNYSTFKYNSDMQAILPEPTEKQENLIAMVASVLIKPNNRSYSLPDIKIQAPAGAMSTEDKIKKIIGVFKKDGHGVFYLVDKTGIE